jgi:serine/threonine protein kinase
MLKLLRHPNIVRYFYTDITKEGDGVDIVLEYVPGGSIRGLLESFGPLDEKLVKLFTQ